MIFPFNVFIGTLIILQVPDFCSKVKKFLSIILLQSEYIKDSFSINSVI